MYFKLGIYPKKRKITLTELYCLTLKVLKIQEVKRIET